MNEMQLNLNVAYKTYILKEDERSSVHSKNVGSPFAKNTVGKDFSPVNSGATSDFVNY